MKIRSYSECEKLTTFSDRLEYLKLDGLIGTETFGSSRYLNQALYTSREWRDFRKRVILRDGGCDLGISGLEISSFSVGPVSGNEYRFNNFIVVHHINPITLDDIENRSPMIFDMDNVISCTKDTHNAIHYGRLNFQKLNSYVERKPNDTIPWR